MDGIERRIGDQAQVLRLNVADSVGRELALRYRVSRVPTLLLLDGSGDVVLRQEGRVRRDEVLEALEQLSGAMSHRLGFQAWALPVDVLDPPHRLSVREQPLDRSVESR
mgnify:CR=1 FL=1